MLLCYKIIKFLYQKLPVWSFIPFHFFISLMLFLILKQSRDVTLSNLRLAFGKKVFKNCLIGIQSYYLFLRYVGKALKKIPDSARVSQIKTSSSAALDFNATHLLSPSLFAFSHYGNFLESIIATASLLKHKQKKLYLAFRNLNPASLQKIISDDATRLNIHFCSRYEMARHCGEWIKDGNSIGILFDNNAAVNGVFIPFFSVPASTMRGIPQIARKHEIPVYFSYTNHQNDKLNPHPFCHYDFIETSGSDIEILTDLHLRLESLIHSNKASYFWAQPRWKKRPSSNTPL